MRWRISEGGVVPISSAGSRPTGGREHSNIVSLGFFVVFGELVEVVFVRSKAQ